MAETTMTLEDAFKLGVAHQEARRFAEAEAGVWIDAWSAKRECSRSEAQADDR